MTAVPGGTQVLIAGGGPVGLATAVELGRRGVRCVVVEPRVEVTHSRPRCKTVNVRTMEHLRRWGLVDRFRAAAPLSTSWSQDIVFCTSLYGFELSRFSGVLGLMHDGDRFPELGQQAPQYVLEELLRSAVEELPTCVLATGWTVTGLEQDLSTVRVHVCDRSGRSTVVDASYVVGCDGPRSTVRELVGARYVGELALRPNFGMVFTASLDPDAVVPGRAVQYWILNDVAPALMGPLDRAGTWWIIAFGVTEDEGRRDAHRLIEAAVGAPVDATVLSTDPWTARMQLVDRLRVGRVFLAGDAAHLNPPFGGHGLNTGIGDAVDLGWKLAAVLDGWATDGLLDSYVTERRPVQDRVIDEATRNMRTLAPELMSEALDAPSQLGETARAAAHLRIQEAKRDEFFALDLVLDVALDESPIVCHSEEGTGMVRAGRRLPHAWLAPGQSLFDELGLGMSLLLLTPADPTQIVDAAAASSVPLTVLDLTHTDLAVRWEVEAALVRPDQYVAWAGSLSRLDAPSLVIRIRGAA